MGFDEELNRQYGGPRSDRIFVWVFVVVLGLLAVVIIADIASGDGRSRGRGSGSSCEAVYAKHLSNAREFGYPPDDRSSFIDACERGHRELNDVISP